MESTATQSARRYFCHHCNTTISHTLPDYECPQCNQGFIEKLPDGPSPSSSFSERNSTNGDELSSMVMDSVSNNMGNILEVMFSRNEGIQGANSNDRPSSSSRRENPNSGRNVRRLQNQTTLEHVLAEFLGMSQNGPYTDNNGPVRFLVSNPGDYAWGREGLDTIVTQLFNQMDSSGPPPLAKEKIQELPYINVTKEQVSENIQCSVCWDLFRVEDKVRQLPCEHIYHDPCIVPWLQLHGTCPICRKLLSEEGDRIGGFSPGGSLEALLRAANRSNINNGNMSSASSSTSSSNGSSSSSSSSSSNSSFGAFLDFD